MVLILAVISGAVMSAGFAPFEIWIAPLLGLGLLYRVLDSTSGARRFVSSFLAGLAFFGPMLHWSGTYVGAVPWLALTVLQASMFALLAFGPRTTLGFATTFALIEVIRMKAPFGGFGWGRIGFTQLDSISHVYPVLGVTGISFFAALVSATFATFSLRKMVVLVLVPFSVILLAKPQAVAQIRVTAIQGGVDQLGLDFNQRAMSVFNRHANETAKISSDVDLVVWPENASDIDPERNPLVKRSLAELIRNLDAPVLVGAVEQTPSGPANVSILYGRSGEIASRYQKQDLAPFGEFMPIRPIAEALVPKAKLVRDFVPGEKWVVHQLNGYEFIAPICFEVLDDDLLKSGATSANFLVTQTNNATFGKSAQAAQQLQIIRARAAELHRDFAVVSTTGFTAHVDANGQIAEELEQFQTGSLAMEISAYEERTPASKLRSWHWIVFFASVLLYLKLRTNR